VALDAIAAGVGHDRDSLMDAGSETRMEGEAKKRKKRNKRNVSG
jgi:hypothetical protein